MLEIKNDSNYKITILYSNNIDPAPTENNIEYFTSDNNIIYPNTSKPLFIPGKPDAWHNYINDGAKKRLYIYIFSVDTILKYNGDYTINELVNMHQYLKVLEFSEQQLIANNWRINFQTN